MSEYGNVILTQKGMDFVTSAHDMGVYVDIRYFVPAYDNRIDPNVRLSGYNLSSFTQVATETRTSNNSVGEILWKRTLNYTLDTNNRYIISANTFAGDQLQNSFQKSTTYTNLNDGTPISNQVSANSWIVSGGNGNYNWTASPIGVEVNGLGNSRPTGTPSDFFSTGNYYPVYDTSGQGTLRGAWKCLLSQTLIGNIRFNKILLYAVAIQKEDPDTVVDTCLFGEAYIQNPVVVSNLGIGFDNIEIDVQIDISGTSANFEQLFYSSSADYWSHSPGGLYFPNRIGVGSFEDNQNDIAATMHLRYARQDLNTGVPIIRLDYDNYRFDSIDVSPYQYDVTESTTATIGKIGADIILNVANWATYCGDAISIRPKIASTIALGTSGYPFRELYLINSLVGDGSKDTNSIVPLNIINYKNNHAVNINNNIWLGSSQGANGELSAISIGIRLQKLGIEIEDLQEIYSDYYHSDDLYGVFKGGDLVRDGQNLLIYNTYSIGDLENIYIFAGLSKYASFTSVDGQTGATHKNIIYEIEQKEAGLFCSQNSKLASTSEIILGAKGKIGLFGPVELRNIANEIYSKNTSILISKSNGDYGDLRMLIGAGIKNDTTFDTLATKVENCETIYPPDDFSDVLDNDSRLYLIANKILINSSIIPLINSELSLGSESQIFQKICGKYFKAGDSLNSKGLWIGDISGDVYKESNVNYGIIKLYTQGISHITNAQIGTSNDPIDYGFFEQINSRYIGSDDNEVELAKITSISASNVNSINGYYEGNTTSTRLGYWYDLTSSFKVTTAFYPTDISPDEIRATFYYLGASTYPRTGTYQLKFSLIGNTLMLVGDCISSNIIWTSLQIVFKGSMRMYKPNNMLIVGHGYVDQNNGTAIFGLTTKYINDGFELIRSEGGNIPNVQVGNVNFFIIYEINN